MQEEPNTTDRQTLADTSELRIPGLKILREIGRGGMAKVYMATQESLQRPVAVKLMQHVDRPGFYTRFMNEGRFMAALSHSNIIDVIDVGEVMGYYYIVMEYLPGGDLAQKVENGIKPITALKLAMRIAGCLDYLHAKGIVHRDLKPANILFRGDYNPVITDFGIAKLFLDDNELTQVGAVIGSPFYLSPEQSDTNRPVDGRSDLYSLGVILYEMLTGERPFNGEHFAAIVYAHHSQPIPRLPDALARYQPLIDKLLAKQPDERYQSGQEVVQAIRALSSRKQPENPAAETEPPEDPASHWRIPNYFLFAGLTVVLAMFIVLMFGKHDTTPSAPSQPVPTAELTQAPQPNVQTEPAEPPMQPGEEPGTETPSDVEANASGTPEVAIAEPELSPIRRLLKQGYANIDRARLTLPAHDNALLKFQQILSLEPDNEAAKAGIRQIVRWYDRHARLAIENNDPAKARSYIERGLTIDAQNAQLLALQEELKPATPPAEPEPAPKPPAEEKWWLPKPVNVLDLYE